MIHLRSLGDLRQVPVFLFVTCLVLGVGFSAFGEDKFSQPPATSDLATQLKLRDDLWASAQALRDEGKGKEAIAEAEKMLALERTAFSADDEDLLVSMNWIAETAEHFGELSTAESHRAAAGAWTTKHLKAEDQRIVDARVALTDLKTLQGLSPERQAAVLQSRRESETLDKLLDAKQYTEAMQLAERVLESRRRLLGNRHLLTVEAVRETARVFYAQDKYREAEPFYREVCELRKSILGSDHSEFAAALFSLALTYRDLEDFRRAEELLRQTLDLEKRILGENNSKYGWSLKELGSLYQRWGRYADAEPLLVQSLAIYRTLYGEVNEDVGIALNDLAFLYERMGRYKRAEEMYRQSLAAKGRDDGEPTARSITTLHNLARLYKSTGDYVRSLPLSLKVVEWKRRSLGDEDPDYALSLNNLGWTYYVLGDYGRAEEAMLTAKRIYETRLGRGHTRYADSLESLATVYRATDRRPQAERYLKESAKIYLTVLGKRHPDYIDSLEGLAEDARRAQNYDRALSLLTEVRELEKEVLGPEHPYYAATLTKLGTLHRIRGEFEQAETLYRDAIEIDRQVGGEAKLDFASKLERLAFLYASTGKPEQAEPLYRQALAVARKCVEATAAVQSERQQLALSADSRYQLDSYLSFCANTNRSVADVYTQVLLWKGATLVRQRAMRAATTDPQLKQLFEELQALSMQLANRTRHMPKFEAERTTWRAQIDALNRRKEAVEAELSGRSGEFRQALRDTTIDDLLAALPDDAVLIDFLQYDRIWPGEAAGKPSTWRRDFAAFIVRRSDVKEDRVRLVSLGSSVPIDKAVDEWRKTFGIGTAGAEAGKRLRELLWKPLTDSIGAQRTVVISTDGALGKLPFGALPGSQPDTYLIEDLRVAMLPVPQLLPKLFATGSPRPKDVDLLLLGDVDYDAKDPPKTDRTPASEPNSSMISLAAATDDAGNRAPVEGTDKFSKLPGTKIEIDAIGRSFGRVQSTPQRIRTLASFEATEANFRELAPRSRYLHLATHGFFAPGKYHSMLFKDSTDDDGEHAAAAEDRLVGFSPNLLSGLVLAGANQTPSDDGDDGILTAEEIACLSLDDAQLVVLSACETGLGEVAGGEGLLGLQRAFQVSGARTTIASYWKVDDFVTQALMRRFYRNIVETTGSQPVSILDALREAQLWALRNPGELAKSADDRSADLLRSGTALQNPGREPRTSPRFWAAFSLSGDWR